MNEKIIHHINPADLAILRGIFAFFTEDGWIIPDWLIYLEDNVHETKLRPTVSDYLPRMLGRAR